MRAVVAIGARATRVLATGAFGLAGTATLSCSADAPSASTRSAERPETAEKCASSQLGACDERFVACVQGAAAQARRCYDECESDKSCERCKDVAATGVGECRSGVDVCKMGR